MTSFAFVAGLIPLVFATGAGAIGNRTIGTTGAGGMLLGTVIGVLIIPGLYYIFAKIADGRKILNDESNDPLSEVFEHGGHHDHPAESAFLAHGAALPVPPPDHVPPPGDDEGDLPEASEIPPDAPPPPSHPYPPPGGTEG
jgi:HAE1 family hydrophobic/amphiphilic exporter-1